MKKLLTYLIILIVAVGCSNTNPNKENPSEVELDFTNLNHTEFNVFENYSINLPVGSFDTSFIDNQGFSTNHLIFENITFVCHEVGLDKEYIPAMKSSIHDSLLNEVLLINDTAQGLYRFIIDSKLGSIEYSLIDSNENGSIIGSTHNALNVSVDFNNETEKEFILQRLKSIKKKINFNYLNGIWAENLNENSLFKITGDSLTYTDSFETYYISMKADTILIDYRDWIYKGIVTQLTEDELIIEDIDDKENLKLIRFK
jgi:hypothetical protein